MLLGSLSSCRQMALVSLITFLGLKNTSGSPGPLGSSLLDEQQKEFFQTLSYQRTPYADPIVQTLLLRKVLDESRQTYTGFA